MKTLPSILFFALIQWNLNAQNTLFVDAANSGTQNGMSWSTAFADLQDALDAAASGDSIFVAFGTYLPSTALAGSMNDRDKTFELKEGVLLYGGFNGTENSLAERASDSASLHVTNATVLSGDLGASGDSTDNAYHVVVAVALSNATLMDGFTITHGNANSTDSLMVGSNVLHKNYGAGMTNISSELILDQVVFKRNHASRGGAGLNNLNADPTITHCVFTQNRVTGNFPQDPNGGGAGMRNSNSSPILNHCSFIANKTYHNQGGGGIRNENGSNALISNTLFTENFADDGDGGAGMYCASGSNAILSYCTFRNNHTTEQGGAAYHDSSIPEYVQCIIKNNAADGGAGAMESDGGSHIILNECVFRSNSTLGNGGALQNWKSSPIITECTFESNTASNDGGGIFNYTECSPLVTNCIFKGNIAGQNGGGIYNRRDCNPVMTNVLFYDNEAGDLGGGAYTAMSHSSPCNPIATNITMTSNTAGNSGGGIYDDGAGDSKMRNSILFDNSAPSNPDVDAPAALAVTGLTFSVIGLEYFESGSAVPVPWSGNLFVDAMSEDYRLVSGSIGINTGDSIYYAANQTPDLSYITTDLQGGDRIQGANVDLGAYESCFDTLDLSVEITVAPNDSVQDSTDVTFTAVADSGGTVISYQWYYEGQVLAGENGMSLTKTAGVDFASLESFQVLITTDEPCVMSDSVWSELVMVYIYPPDTTDTMPDDSAGGISAISRSAFKLYPNPVNKGADLQILLMNDAQSGWINITDIAGRSISTQRITRNQHNLSLPTGLKNGAYICSFRSDKGKISHQKFVLLE
ncbi:MAG: right-handed parallel beta-helix repeat-containing protein [Salibacteraceae bacterium]